MFIREYFGDGSVVTDTVSKRISGIISLIVAELYAISEGLQMVLLKSKEAYIFVDSMSALKALLKHSCSCHAVSMCKSLVTARDEL